MESDELPGDRKYGIKDGRTNLVWSDVQGLAELHGEVSGPLEAALPHAVGPVHEEEDVHGC